MHPPHHSHSSHWRHQVSHPSSSGHVPPPPGGDEDYGPSGRASSSSFAWEGRPRREDASDFAASSAASSVPLKNLGGHAHPPRAGFGYGESFHGGGEASAAAFEAFVEGEASRGSWSEEPLTAEKQRSLQGFSAANAGLRGAGPSSSFSGGPRQGSSAYPHSHPHSHSHLHSQSSSSACCYKLAASSLSAAPPAFPLGQGGSFPEGGAGAFSNWISTTPSTAPGGLPPPSGLSRRSRRSSAEQPLPAGSAHSAVAAACVARPEAILWVHQPCAARPSSLAPSFVSTGPRAELAVEGAGAGAVDADGFFPSLGVSDELAGMAGLGGVGSSEGAGAGPPWISAGRRRLAPSSSGTSFSYIPSRDPRLPPAEKERIARQWLSAPRRSLSEESGGGSFCGSRPEVVASVEASRAWVRMKASKRAAQKPGKSLPAFHLDPAASSSWLTRESGLFSPVVEREASVEEILAEDATCVLRGGALKPRVNFDSHRTTWRLPLEELRPLLLIPCYAPEEEPWTPGTTWLCIAGLPRCCKASRVATVLSTAWQRALGGGPVALEDCAASSLLQSAGPAVVASESATGAASSHSSRTQSVGTLGSLIEGLDCLWASPCDELRALQQQPPLQPAVGEGQAVAGGGAALPLQPLGGRASLDEALEASTGDAPPMASASLAAAAAACAAASSRPGAAGGLHSEAEEAKALSCLLPEECGIKAAHLLVGADESALNSFGEWRSTRSLSRASQTGWSGGGLSPSRSHQDCASPAGPARLPALALVEAVDAEAARRLWIVCSSGECSAYGVPLIMRPDPTRLRLYCEAAASLFSQRHLLIHQRLFKAKAEECERRRQKQGRQQHSQARAEGRECVVAVAPYSSEEDFQMLGEVAEKVWKAKCQLLSDEDGGVCALAFATLADAQKHAVVECEFASPEGKAVLALLLGIPPASGVPPPEASEASPDWRLLPVAIRDPPSPPAESSGSSASSLPSQVPKALREALAGAEALEALEAQTKRRQQHTTQPHRLSSERDSSAGLRAEHPPPATRLPWGEAKTLAAGREGASSAASVALSATATAASPKGNFPSRPSGLVCAVRGRRPFPFAARASAVTPLAGEASAAGEKASWSLAGGGESGSGDEVVLLSTATAKAAAAAKKASKLQAAPASASAPGLAGAGPAASSTLITASAVCGSAPNRPAAKSSAYVSRAFAKTPSASQQQGLVEGSSPAKAATAMASARRRPAAPSRRPKASSSEASSSSSSSASSSSDSSSSSAGDSSAEDEEALSQKKKPDAATAAAAAAPGGGEVSAAREGRSSPPAAKASPSRKTGVFDESRGSEAEKSRASAAAKRASLTGRVAVSEAKASAATAEAPTPSAEPSAEASSEGLFSSRRPVGRQRKRKSEGDAAAEAESSQREASQKEASQKEASQKEASQGLPRRADARGGKRRRGALAATTPLRVSPRLSGAIPILGKDMWAPPEPKPSAAPEAPPSPREEGAHEQQQETPPLAPSQRALPASPEDLLVRETLASESASSAIRASQKEAAAEKEQNKEEGVPVPAEDSKREAELQSQPQPRTASPSENEAPTKNEPPPNSEALAEPTPAVQTLEKPADPGEPSATPRLEPSGDPSNCSDGEAEEPSSKHEGREPEGRRGRRRGGGGGKRERGVRRERDASGEPGSATQPTRGRGGGAGRRGRKPHSIPLPSRTPPAPSSVRRSNRLKGEGEAESPDASSGRRSSRSLSESAPAP